MSVSLKTIDSAPDWTLEYRVASSSVTHTLDIFLQVSHKAKLEKTFLVSQIYCFVATNKR